MSLNAHRIPSWRTEETACIGMAAYTKAITRSLLQTGNAQKPPLEVSSTRLVPPFTPHLPNTTMPYYNAGTRVIPSSCPEVSSRPATCCNPGTGKPPPRNMDGGPGWAVEPGRTAGVALSGVRRGAEMCVTYMSVLVRRRHHMWADGFGSLRGSHEGMTRPRGRGEPDAGSTDTRHALVAGTRGWVGERLAGCETARRGSVGMDENGGRKGV